MSYTLPGVIVEHIVVYLPTADRAQRKNLLCKLFVLGYPRRYGYGFFGTAVSFYEKMLLYVLTCMK